VPILPISDLRIGLTLIARIILVLLEMLGHLFGSTRLAMLRDGFVLSEQELTYQKQIVCQLHTQYVEGIYRPKYYAVTLKCRLRVTQGHWKWNHCIDHTELTIS